MSTGAPRIACERCAAAVQPGDVRISLEGTRVCRACEAVIQIAAAEPAVRPPYPWGKASIGLGVASFLCLGLVLVEPFTAVIGSFLLAGGAAGAFVASRKRPASEADKRLGAIGGGLALAGCSVAAVVFVFISAVTLMAAVYFGWLFGKILGLW